MAARAACGSRAADGSHLVGGLRPCAVAAALVAALGARASRSRQRADRRLRFASGPPAVAWRRRWSGRIVAAEAETGGADNNSKEGAASLLEQFLQQSRTSAHVGIATSDWSPEWCDDVPDGYFAALEEGVEMVDVVAGSYAMKLLADASSPSRSSSFSSPSYSVRLAPRTTLGLGYMLSGPAVRKWAVIDPLEAAMKQLGVEMVEVLTLEGKGRHLRFPSWVYDAVVEAYQEGLCNKIFVRHPAPTSASIERVKEELQRRGTILSGVVLELSLLRPEALGFTEECCSADLEVFAELPLGDGDLASGRYTDRNPTGGELTAPRFVLQQLTPLKPLFEALGKVAARARKRLEKTSIDTTQVALQWVRSKGARPLCDVAVEANAKAVVGLTGWSLSEKEVAILDAAADQVHRKRPRR